MKGLRRKNQQKNQQQQDDSGSSLGKRTPTPNGNPEEWRLEAAIVSLLTLTDADNRLICPPFRVLPTPEEFPLYYKRINKPIDLKRIATNIREGKYLTWQTIEADIKLMCENAKEFNEPGSMVYKDANRLLQHFQTKAGDLAEARRSSQRVILKNKQVIDELLRPATSEFDEFSEDSEEDEDSEKSVDSKWRLYWTIRNFNVVDGVPLCENFMELPSKRSYPDYYDEIEHPISLYMINKKLKRGQYQTLVALVQDLLLMVDNACDYNIEDSEIYVAAIRLGRLTLETAQSLDPELRLPKKKIYLTIKNEQSVETVDIYENGTCNGVCNGTNVIAKQNKITTDISTAIVTKSELEIEKTEIIPDEQKINDVSSISDATTSTAVCDDMLQMISVEENAVTQFAKNGSSSRRRRLNPNERHKPGRKSIDELREKFAKVLMDVWQDVKDLKMGNRILSEPFLYLPCDKTFPDYYESIKQPISLTCIKNKITDSMYNDSDEMLKDLKMMFENARSYNRADSQIYTDSFILESVANGSMKSRTAGTTIFYPHKRSDKGWTEQSSITKSPLKPLKKKCYHSNPITDERNKSVSANVTPSVQTIILPPGYTGPKQQHQIVVHTQPPPQSQQQVHLVQSTSGKNITAANQAAHYKQSQQQQQQLVQQRNVQQYAASPGMTQNSHPQQQHLISNGIPVSTGVHATQYIAASSIPSSPAVTALSGHSGLPASYQQQQHIAAIAHQQPSTSTAIYQNHATTVAVPTLSNNVQTSSTATVQQQQLLIDPGRTIVTAPKAPEPLFVSPSNSVSVKRALHSEVYVRYIESLHVGVGTSKPQRTVSKWDKALEASHRNTVVPSQRKLPYDWIRHVTNGSKPKEDQIVRALWSLREHLVEGTTGINRNEYHSNPSEAIAPNFHFDEPSKKNNGNYQN